MKFPESFDDLSELVTRIWVLSPMAVGIVVGLMGVGLLKLFTVCMCGARYRSLLRSYQGGFSAEQTPSLEAEKKSAGKTE